MIPSPVEIPPPAVAQLKALIEALRDELQQYGEMLVRLDTQQQLILRRASEEMADAVHHIEQHQGVLQRARRHRETCQQATSLALSLPISATFQELIPRLPEDYRPLVGALIQENNELLVRVQQRARQNHLMLFRTLELMQKLMHNLLPPSGSPGYNSFGQGTGYGVPSRTLYEAVG